jgi:hypothetical protein
MFNKAELKLIAEGMHTLAVAVRRGNTPKVEAKVREDNRIYANALDAVSAKAGIMAEGEPVPQMRMPAAEWPDTLAEVRLFDGG